jgi:hypothetical protein
MWLILVGAIIVLCELNALMGTQGPTKRPLDTVSGVITAGFVLWVVLIAAIAVSFA